MSNCPVCYNEINDPFVTKCNHTFCKNCISILCDLCEEEFPCPICRTNLYIKKENIPIPAFNPDNYPKESNLTTEMLKFAYETISKNNDWEYLHDFVVDESVGFMNCKDAKIREIMNKIAKDYDNHTGFTMGYTMRQMHFIAKYGLHKYLQFIEHL
jgi:RING-type zinc-finger